MEKKVYTIEEVLLSLRKEYLNYEKLLYKLKNYILIEDKKVEDYFFDTHSKTMYYDKLVYEKQLVLIIVEKLNTINKIREKLSFLSGNDYENSNMLFYNVNNYRDGHFVFDFDYKDSLVSINPEINITDQAKFDKLVTKILNTNFMNLEKQQFEKLDRDGWSLHLYNRLMLLGSYYQNVIYNPKYDTIKFIGTDYNEDGAKSMIKSEIPKYCIPDNIKTIINKNLQEGKIIEFDEYSFDNKVTTFQIEDTSKGIKLLKIK